jgi:hypothetical protein
MPVARSEGGYKGWGVDTTPTLFERSTGFLLRAFSENRME